MEPFGPASPVWPSLIERCKKERKRERKSEGEGKEEDGEEEVQG